MAQTTGEAIAAHARLDGNAPALLSPGKNALSFGALHQLVLTTRSDLNAAGLGRGSRVAIAVAARPVACAVYLCVTSSATAVPISPELTLHETEALLDSLNIDALVASEDAFAAVKAAQNLGIHSILLESMGNAAGQFLMRATSRGGTSQQTVLPDDMACIQASSGTSANPKAVKLSHRCLMFRAARDRSLLGLGPEDVTINFRPTHLSGPLNIGLLASIAAGGSVVVPDVFDPELVFDALDHYGVTWFTGGPVYHEAILEHGDTLPSARRSHRLRFVRSAGYALPRTLEQRIEDFFGVPCIQKYGSSEAGLVACNPLPPGRRKPGTCGPVTGCEVRLLRDDGEVAAPGEGGEIAVKGPGVFAGYDSLSATGSSFHDGFFKTGDTGVFDEDGYLTLQGRKSEIINRGGQKVSPEEVEEAICTHPAVKDALCFPVPHETLGETVAIAVRTHAKQKVNETALLDIAKGRLGRFKVPEQIIFANEFPRGSGGKPLRRKAAGWFGLTDKRSVAKGLKPTDRLGELWCAVLKTETVDEHENFVLSGGDSLRGSKLLLMIEREFGLSLPVDVLYGEAATLNGLRQNIGQASATDQPRSKIAGRIDPAAPIDLTSAQMRLYAINQTYPDVPIYNSAFGLRFNPPPSIDALQRAVDIVISRHEALRARFPENRGHVEQVFDPDRRIEVTIEDLSDVPAPEREASFQTKARRAAAVPYDLKSGPVARARAFLFGDDCTALVFQSHHIVTDALSTSILAREISALVTSNGIATLSPVEIGFGDVVAEQHRQLADGGREQLLADWRVELDGASTKLELPCDRPRPRVQSHRGARLRLGFGADIATGLRKLAVTCGTTPFAAAFAAFQVVMFRMTGQEDFLVGTGADERPPGFQDNLVGFFVGTLPIRAQIEPTATFRSHARAAHDRLARARELKNVPLDLLIRDHAEQSRDGMPPLVQVVVGMMPKDARERTMKSVEVDYFNFDHDRARFDLTLMLDELEDGIGGFFEYATDILDEESARLLLNRLETVLREVIRSPDRPVNTLTVIPPGERRRIAEASRGPSLDYEARSVPELFAKVVRRGPDRTAIIQGARSVTYAMLDRMSDQICSTLRADGARPCDIVGVLADRSPEFIASLLGVLKAGCAYLALDPDMPDARLKTLLEMPEATACLASEGIAGRIDGFGGRVLKPITLTGANGSSAQSVPSVPELASDALAYVAFTSGSTGRPKGVCITHRNILRHVTGLGQISPKPDDRVLNLSSAAFDASTFEIWGGLLTGATIIQPETAQLTINALADLILAENVSILWLTAGLFHQVTDLRPDCLKGGRKVIAGGDALSVSHLKKVLTNAPDSFFYNGYGPTENTTFSTLCRIDEALLTGGDAPIGKPVANSTAHVLDAEMRPVPIGCAGDLWVGGDGVALGYLRMAAETAARFVADPFSSDTGARLYKTGDRARRDHAGNLHFLGRQDAQIKLRGYRVELQEVEAALRQLPTVRDAAVVARREAFEVKSLSAFLVAGKDQQRTDVADIRGALATVLPNWMVPSEFSWVDTLPLNTSGKVDRGKLLDLDLVTETGESVSPRTALEELIAGLWSEVLGQDEFGIDDNFFELGGQSLMAMRLSFRLEEETGLSAAVTDLFTNPTIRSLAAVITEDLLDGAPTQEMEA